MSSKPLVQPKWAATTTFTTPSSGKQNAGWKTGERPPAGYFNFLHFWTWQWIKWLDEGDVSFADVQTATLEASGNVTIGGTLDITGALGVTGALTAGASTLASATVSGTLAVGDDVTLSTGKNIHLQGTGHITHTGTRTEFFPGALGQPSSSAVSAVTSSGPAIFYSATGAIDTISIPITLEVGARIVAVRCYCNDDGLSHVVSAQLKSVNAASDATATLSNAVSTSNAGVTQTLTLTNLGGGAGFVDVAAGFGYSVQFSVAGSTTGRHINGVEVEWTRPS